MNLVRLMLQTRSPYVAPLQGGHTPLTWAAYKGRTTVVNVLLAMGADKEVANMVRCSCVSQAHEG